jgi:hypothetical protein
MSFVITEPELVQGAAQNLAGIRSSLAEATSTATGPTTGIAAAAQDEISVAVSSLFGDFGQQFHALNAQAQAFHAEFENLLSSGASAYVSAETNGAASLLSGHIQTGAQAAAQSGLLGGIESFGATVAAPYQSLVSNTVNNLQAIGGTISANPFPLLHQVGTNQLAYGQTIATGLESVFGNIPAAVANIPTNIHIAIQGASTFNPAGLLQQFVNQQIGYGQTVATGLQSAGPDLIASLRGLPAAFGSAFQDLVMGNPVGAYHALNTGLVNAILPGFHTVTLDLSVPPSLLPIVPLGALGDLAPVFGIPGQMAQNFTNLLPPGSIPAQISQNFTNLLSTATNFGSTLNGANLGITFGLPLQVIFDVIGAPINALGALNSSAVAFGGALQTGNASAAAIALLDAPANMANGFLNGQTLVDLPPLNVNLVFDGASLGSLSSVAALPVGGLLTPLSPIVLTGNGGGPLPGTQIGGIIPGLLSFESELAAAITPLG